MSIGGPILVHHDLGAASHGSTVNIFKALSTAFVAIKGTRPFRHAAARRAVGHGHQQALLDWERLLPRLDGSVEVLEV